MKKQQAFLLEVIGTIKQNDTQSSIQLDEKYHKGLKYLSLFSHATLCYEEHEQPNIYPTTLSQSVVAIAAFDETNGSFSTKNRFTRNGTHSLYDIKPYFPDEDRVKQASISASPLTIRKQISDTLSQIGTIYKEQGNYYIDITHHFYQLLPIFQHCSHIKLVWWFHKFDTSTYRHTLMCHPPYEQAPKSGVFATRSPVRPNPLAITIARIINIDTQLQRIYVSKLDCFDETPLLGISPYNPKLDCIDAFTLPSWLQHWPKWVDDSLFTISHEINIKPSFHELLTPYLKPSDNALKITTSKQRLTSSQPANQIIIKGASQHNLKHIDVAIPHGSITVFTGVSGSGKSSLAFDTLFAESQQRFFANMTFSMRSQLSMMEKHVPLCSH